MDKSYTLLIAHPDDEVLWMWPVLMPGKVRRIVCLSSDLNNPERRWCRDRKRCLQEIGKQIDAEVVCFDYDSEFYRQPTRNGALKMLATAAVVSLESPVFTHNAWGEYGHIDHILCHQIALSSGHEVWSTDIACEINWLPIGKRARHETRAQMASQLFGLMKSVYDARGCWTWSFDPILECGYGRIC